MKIKTTRRRFQMNILRNIYFLILMIETIFIIIKYNLILFIYIIHNCIYILNTISFFF
jgi:hypothetical protein